MEIQNPQVLSISLKLGGIKKGSVEARAIASLVLKNINSCIFIG